MYPAQAAEKTALATLRRSSRALDEAKHRSSPTLMSQALAGMAHGCRALRDEASAEIYLDEALRWARVTGLTDPIVDLLCELCEVCAAQIEADDLDGAYAGSAACERMREHAFEASTLANRVADGGWEAKVLMRISAVLERCGDRDDAVLLQTRALRLMSGSLAGGAPDPTLLPSLGRLADV